MTYTSPNVATKSTKVETAAATRLLFIDDMTSVRVLYQLVLSAHAIVTGRRSSGIVVVGCIQYNYMCMCAPHEHGGLIEVRTAVPDAKGICFTATATATIWLLLVGVQSTINHQPSSIPLPLSRYQSALLVIGPDRVLFLSTHSRSPSSSCRRQHRRSYLLCLFCRRAVNNNSSSPESL